MIMKNLTRLIPLTSALGALLVGCGGTALMHRDLPEYALSYNDYSGANKLEGFEISVTRPHCMLEMTFRNNAPVPNKLLLSESSIKSGNTTYPIVARIPSDGDNYGFRSTQLGDILIPPNTEIRMFLNPRTGFDNYGQWREFYLCPTSDVYTDSVKRERSVGSDTHVQLMLTQMDKRVYATWVINLTRWISNPKCTQNPKKCEPPEKSGA